MGNEQSVNNQSRKLQKQIKTLIRSRETQRQVCCPICDLRFFTIAPPDQAINEHIRQNHSGFQREVHCPICGEGFYAFGPPEQAISQHIEQKHKKTQGQVHCPICGEGLHLTGSAEQAINEHIEITHLVPNTDFQPRNFRNIPQAPGFQPKLPKENQKNTGARRRISEPPEEYPKFRAIRKRIAESPEENQKITAVRNQLAGLKVDWASNHVKLLISRTDFFMNSMEQLLSLDSRGLRSEFQVQFNGEKAQDAGGLTKEWLNLMVKDFLSDGFKLFQLTNTEEPRYTIVKNNLDPDLYQTFGKIIGKAIFENIPIDCNLSPLILKLILGCSVDNEDIKYLDTDLYNSMKFILSNNIDGVIFETFAYIDEHNRAFEFIPDGRNIEINEENKEVYISLRAEFELRTSIEFSVKNIQDGIFSVFPQNCLAGLTADDLDFLICGCPYIDVVEWSLFTVYKGRFTKDHTVIKWFWEVLVQEFSQGDLRDLLTFVTGTSRVPVEGFGSLKTTRGDPAQFAIESMEYQRGMLPRAHTCFNRLDLPLYKTKPELKHALIEVITNHKFGFGLE